MHINSPEKQNKKYFLRLTEAQMILTMILIFSLLFLPVLSCTDTETDMTIKLYLCETAKISFTYPTSALLYLLCGFFTSAHAGITSTGRKKRVLPRIFFSVGTVFFIAASLIFIISTEHIRNRILDSLYFGPYVADTVILQNNPDRLSVSQKARKISELRPIQTDEINKNIFEISIAILHNIGYNKVNNELRRFKYENR